MTTFEVVLVHPTEPKTVRLPPLALAPEQISDAKFLIEGVRAAYGVEAVVLKRLGGRRGPNRRFEFCRYALRALAPELTPRLTWAEGPASLALLQRRRARGLSTHPFFWAGFVASGDWR